MKYVVLGLGLGFVISYLLNATGLHWLDEPVIGLLAAFVVIGQLTVWYRQGWRLRWPPGRR